MQNLYVLLNTLYFDWFKIKIKIKENFKKNQLLFETIKLKDKFVHSDLATFRHGATLLMTSIVIFLYCL